MLIASQIMLVPVVPSVCCLRVLSLVSSPLAAGGAQVFRVEEKIRGIRRGTISSIQIGAGQSILSLRTGREPAQL